MNLIIFSHNDLLSAKNLSLLMSQSSELADPKARSVQIAGKYSFTPGSLGSVGSLVQRPVL